MVSGYASWTDKEVAVPERDTGARPDERLLAERYGVRPARHRQLLVAAVAVLAAAGAGWLGWAAWEHANPPVRGELHSFDVLSDRTVSVVVDVDRRDDGDVVCTVRAQADDQAIVGEQEVTFPAGPDGEQRFTVELSTERRATTATVTNCHQ
jgi:hypothetical protein